MRLRHTADGQHGMNRHVFDDHGSARFSEAREAVLRRIGEVAREQSAGLGMAPGGSRIPDATIVDLWSDDGAADATGA